MTHASVPREEREKFGLTDSLVRFSVGLEDVEDLIEDVQNDNMVKPSGWKGYRNGSVLAFPLPDETGQIVGVVTLHNKSLPPFIEQDKEIGSILASYSCETLRATRSGRSLPTDAFSS